MSMSIGTAKSTGAISTANSAVLVIEFHARSDNEQSVYIGGSDMTSTNGRELPPGETFMMNFALPDILAHAGKVLLSSFYVQVSGRDMADWSAIIRDPAA